MRAEASRSNRYVIKPEFSEELGTIKTDLDAAQDSLDEAYATAAADLGFSTDGKTLHFEKHTTYGYTFRLTRKVGLSTQARESLLMQLRRKVAL